MRLYSLVLFCLSLSLSACLHRCPNPQDPLETFNRQVFKMNMAFDATVLQPPARLYILLIPAPFRAAVNNIYLNIATLPTIANDLLQLQYRHSVNDIGRLILNSSLGLGGIGDVASQLGVPIHKNDFGLTLAYWGNTSSPYVIIPFLGPSTLRDAMSYLVDYTFFTPYPLLADAILYNVLALRYVDLRSQMMDHMKLIHNALDPYTMMKDAYLQYRAGLIAQNQRQTESDQDNSESLYLQSQEN